jgi:hypothetical protein
MRLEKILYEKVFNSKMLCRKRNITRPQRNQTDEDQWLSLLPTFKFFHLFDGIVTWFMSREWKYRKLRLDQMGLSVEDMTLYVEEEFRRSPYLEHIFRESTHPYQNLFFQWRRSRYFKVDMVLKGFEAPQYVREEGQQRTFFDSYVNQYKWQHFVNHNYNSEITPTTYMYNGTRTLLELFMVYGLVSRSAWNRLFYNEERTYGIHHLNEDLNDHNKDSKKNLDFSNPEDLKEFEVRANEWNEKFPGYFAPEGEAVNMKRIVATLDNIKEEFEFEKLTSRDLGIVAIQAKLDKMTFKAPSYENEGVTGKNNIGTKYPSFLEKPETGSILSSK